MNISYESIEDAVTSSPYLPQYKVVGSNGQMQHNATGSSFFTESNPEAQNRSRRCEALLLQTQHTEPCRLTETHIAYAHMCPRLEGAWETC